MISVITTLFSRGRALSLIPVFAVCLLTLPGTSSALIADSAYVSPPAGASERSVSSELEQDLRQKGLICANMLDPSIIVDLKYARSDNFMGVNVYRGLNRAYLLPEAAEKLVAASRILQEQYPELRILVGDAVRPRSVQQKMWQLVVNTPRQPYVANPKWGSMHNYGAAVDVTLFNVKTGKRVDMGTPLDHFGLLAQPLLEDAFLRQGKLTSSQIENRLILRNAMLDAGWHMINIEWWHFNAFPKEVIRDSFLIIE
ncbi:M15 family metallopeptidase [Desulfopila inferna]|uniref:M15 family metallopeptidase n=1 Tax=Desulfopila inferna TaxID=468528 RepID=UPI001962C258|nr:M15 family metallopeptidase [Desulfopila inferna]MBM9604055.1 M15 family metallopeptidase [Desulfopila inferna]